MSPNDQNSLPSDLRRLLDLLNRHLTLDDLRNLCLTLGVEYENLGGGERRRSKARELLLELQRQKRLDDLLDHLSQSRPGVDWHGGPPPEAELPYKGLHAFGESDAPNFFGREAFTATLVSAVQAQSLVAVIGPSGSGKSSVVFAGLVPELRRQGSWLIVHFRPGGDPFMSLARGLLPILDPEVDRIDWPARMRKLAARLRSGEATLGDYLELIRQDHPEARLLLICDQFEELYTQVNSVERQPFLDVLLAARDDDGARPFTTLILTLRADFMGQALAYPPMVDALQNNDRKIGLMSQGELQAAIEQPAYRQGVRFEEGLVARILEDVGDHAGNLPLLEFALTLLWERQSNGQMTHGAYEAINGVAGALAQYADETLEQIIKDDPTKESAIQRVMVQLVHPGAGAEDSRRIARRAELSDEGWLLVPQLADARLLVTGRQEGIAGDADADPTGSAGEETVEVIHEALIQNWGRLQEWMERDREFRMWQERLREDLYLWQENEQVSGYLLQGSPLTVAEDWLARRRNDLSTAEINYVEQSAQKRSQDRLKRIAVGAFILLLILGAAVTVAVTQNQAATQISIEATRGAEAREAAVAAAATSDHNEGLAEQRKEEAEAARATALAERNEASQQARQARRAFSAQLLAQAEAALDTAPQVSLLLALEAVQITYAANDSLVPKAYELLWGILAKPLEYRLHDHQGNVNAVAISPDSRWLATVEGNNRAPQEGDGVVRVWDLNTSNPANSARQLRSHTGAAYSVSFTPDSDQMVTSGVDGVRLWNLAAADPASALTVLHKQEEPNLVASVHYTQISPDGKWLLAGGVLGVSPELWRLDAANPAEEKFNLSNVGTLISGPYLSNFAFSNDSQRLAISRLGTLGTFDPLNITQLWNLDDQNPLTNTISLEGANMDLSISSDDRWLVSGGFNDNVRLWDISASTSITGAPVLETNGLLPSFGPDARWLAVGNTDDVVRLWDLSATDSMEPSIILAGHEQDVILTRFSPNGRWLVTAGRDLETIAATSLELQELYLWDLWAPDPTTTARELSNPTTNIVSLAFSPDSRWLVAGSNDQTARLWDLTAVEPGASPFILAGHTGSVFSITFSPDSRWLVTAGGFNSFDDRVAHLWDLTAPNLGAAPLILRGHQDDVTTIAVSSDTRWLATGSEDERVLLWDLNELAEPLLSLRARSPVTALAISQDGQSLVTAGEDGTVRIWDLDNTTEPRELHGHEGISTAVVFAPDGQRLIVGSNDNKVRIWDWQNLAESPTVLSTHKGAISSVAVSPDNRWLLTGSLDGAALLWDLDQLSADPRIVTEQNGAVSAVAFSADQEWAVIGDQDGRLQLWPMNNSSDAPVTLTDRPGAITAITSSPDQGWLIAASKDGAIQLWDFRDLTTPPIVLDGHEDGITSAVVSADNRWLITGGLDNAVRLWTLRLDDLLELACSTAGRNLSQKEWDRYFSGLPYQKTCSEWPRGN